MRSKFEVADFPITRYVRKDQERGDADSFTDILNVRAFSCAE